MKKKFLVLLFVSILFVPFFVYAETDYSNELNNDATVINDESTILPETEEPALVEDAVVPEEINDEVVVSEEPQPTVEENTNVIEPQPTVDENVNAEEQQVPSNIVGATSGGEAVEISGLSAPTIGSHPTYAVVTDPAVNIVQQNWVNITDNVIMTSNDVFEAEKLYHYVIRFDTNGQKIIDLEAIFDSSSYSLSGGTMGSVDILYAEWDFYMGTSDFDFDSQELVLDIDTPTLNGHEVRAKTSPNYIINSESWYNVTDNKALEANDVFEANKEYEYTIDLLTPFYIGSSVFDSFKNSPYFLGGTDWGYTGIDSTLHANFYFGPKSDLVVQTGDIIILNNDMPHVGQALLAPDLQLSNNIGDVYVSWSLEEYGYTTDHDITGTQVEAGKVYVLNVGGSLRYGYIFADDFQIINNNTNASLESIDYNYEVSDYNNTGYFWFRARYRALAEGKNFGIKPNNNGMFYEGSHDILTIYPDEYAYESEYTYTWSSSDPFVATIDEFGEVEGLHSGETTITATCSNGETATYLLTVYVKPETMVINPTKATIYIGDTINLEAIITPEEAVYHDISWYTEDYNIIYLADDGVVHANSPGVATVYAEIYADGEFLTATCEIEVLQAIDSVKINVENVTLEIGDYQNVTATVEPASALDFETIHWYTDDDLVAFVDEYGNIYGVSEGETYLHARVGELEDTVLVKVIPTKLTFKDVRESDWYYEVVKFAYDHGIIMGYNNSKFGSNDKVTRGQLVTILWRLEGSPDASHLVNNFKDVANDYYTDAVKWANSNDIIHGYTTIKFGPNDPIIRQDLAVILNNYARYLGLSLAQTADLSTYGDYDKVAGGYAEPALNWAVSNSVMSGKVIDEIKYLGPSDNATRAETAAMISNMVIKFNIMTNKALTSAVQHLNESPYSRRALLRTLLMENYSRQDANYAVEECGANWEEQAEMQINLIVTETPVSYDLLLELLTDNYEYTQEETLTALGNSGINWNDEALRAAILLIAEVPLSYEGTRMVLIQGYQFTEDQATYGATNCGANWNEQAVKAVKLYLQYGDYTTEELMELLINDEYFTTEQAEYGVANA